jgi:Flp pilus assembly pilin Flp
MQQHNSDQSGQSLIEYSMLLGLVLLLAVGLSTVAGQMSSRWSTLATHLTGVQSKPQPTAVERIAGDFLQRIQVFHDKHGRWPRNWGDFRFTDLGMDPAAWAVAVEGVYWNPHGSEVGLANKAGDNLQIYVKDLKGNWLHLYDGWNIWCRAEGCYFHTVAPGNEVDLSTLTLKKP